jgi:L-threonylcarbamoyladenylate synthase
MKTDDIIREAVGVLRSGGVILYPTDTVWGIGCDATDPKAVARVFAIKRRSDSKSLVLLAANLDMVARYVKAVPNIAIDLVEVNDKPMTLIYPGAICGAYGLAENAVAEDGSVGMRIPLPGFWRDLVARLGRPLVSTSANISGEPTPRRFAEISPAIRDAVDYAVPAPLERGSTGSASQIIKVGLGGEVEIIRA